MSARYAFCASLTTHLRNLISRIVNSWLATTVIKTMNESDTENIKEVLRLRCLCAMRFFSVLFSLGRVVSSWISVFVVLVAFPRICT